MHVFPFLGLSSSEGRRGEEDGMTGPMSVHPYRTRVLPYRTYTEKGMSLCMYVYRCVGVYAPFRIYMCVPLGSGKRGKWREREELHSHHGRKRNMERHIDG